MEKKKPLIGICDVKHMFESSVVIFFIFMIGAVATMAFCYGNIYDEQDKTSTAPAPPPSVVVQGAAISYDSLDGCDLLSGKWVHDNHSYPLYKELQCPYITGEFACGQHGRMDSDYQQWRWQPLACNLPRFDAKEVLEKLKGKRVIFVGDSLNRNQWMSMVCMLQSVIPLGRKRMQRVRHSSLITFKALEYNISVDFYWAPLLVESNADHPTMHKTDDRIVRIKSIEKHAKNWVNTDVLVFNSYLWWRMPELKILNGSFQDSKQYKVVDSHHGYRMVLEVWSNWLYTHINHTRTQSYFMSMTATHLSGKEWGMKEGRNCFNETNPIMKDRFWESGSDSKIMRILESSLNKLKAKGVTVQMVNITQLTQYRKDAHPSIHRMHNSPLTATQLLKPSSYADCTHWCLPGVPDVWNELLLSYILRGHK